MNPEVKADPPKKGETNTTVSAASGTNAVAATNSVASALKAKEASKPTDVVFVVQGDHVEDGVGENRHLRRQLLGNCDGLTNGQEIVSGGYRAVGRDLKDGSKIRVGPAELVAPGANP
jgi:hypothetical protein